MKTPPIIAAAAAALVLAASPAAGQRALLWVPADTAGTQEIVELLEKDDALRLTAAFDALPKGLEGRLLYLSAEGRLELAMRPAGDPPLTLLYYPASPFVSWEGKLSPPADPSASYFLSLRLGNARAAAAKALGAPPAGLVSPPGALAPDLFPLAGAFGVKWIACGPIASTATGVLQSGGVAAVPFEPFRTGLGPFLVFDEISSDDPAAVRAALVAELSSGAGGLFTVSGALAALPAATAPALDISSAAAPWTGDHSSLASDPLQAGALAALARTRSDLMLHLNAEQGNLSQAEPAFREYFSAENGAALRALASTSTAQSAELELRMTLANTYRLMRKPPPRWAFTSLADAVSPEAGEEKISFSSIPGGFEAKNVSRQASPPLKTPGLPEGADPAAVWKLSAMRISDGPAGTLFQFRPAKLDNADGNPSGFSHAHIDLYMDVNHRPRAGIASPLGGRPFRFIPENAWEYALEITPSGATLYRITPRGPARAGKFSVKAEDGWVRVLVPGTSLRGNPKAWSYAAMLLARDGDSYKLTDYIADDISNGYIYSARSEAK